MGEFATYNGGKIKIGTCESMYYLRADQARDVESIRGSLDPWRARFSIRFRFPFPDEDGTAPGAFEDSDHSLVIPQGYEFIDSNADSHHSLQLSSNHPGGYNVSLPCPQSGKVIEGVKLYRNGGRAGWAISQQKYLKSGDLVTVISCAVCGCLYRIESPEEAAKIAGCFRMEANAVDLDFKCRTTPRYTPEYQAFLCEIADRIVAGYLVTA